jgi:hypothetical protein
MRCSNGGVFVTEPKDNEAGDVGHAGGTPRHAAPDGADRHPLIDLTRDPTPGVADHARRDDEEDER